MEKAAKSTCGRCRAKKIRCDGQNPCGPCSRARVDSINCIYTAAVVPHGPELRKGAACSACRRKKKKCSGDWPCRTCIICKKEDDCKYDDGSQLSFTRALIERTRELEELLCEAKQTSTTLNYPVGPDLSAELDQLLSSNAFAAPEPMLFAEDPFFTHLDAGSVAEPLSPDGDPFKIFEAGFNPVLQANPSAPLEQVIESPQEKMSRLALMAGDLSGTIVHPVLVHVCHLWGFMLDYYQRTNSWTYAPDKNSDEAVQMRLILGSLAGMLGPAPNTVTTLMTYLSVSLYFFHKQNDLDLAALAKVPAETEDNGGTYSMLPLDDAGELRSAYSHLIYTGLAAKVVLTAPSDTRVTNNADINFMRAKSLRLLMQTRQLTAAWNAGQSPPPSWFEQYWKYIETLHAHIGVLNPTQLRVSFIPDAHTTELALKLCATMALAALADLHGIFAPSHAESSRRYRDAVVEIVSISSTFSMDDCQYLDPILPLCWSVATKRILDSEVIYENQESIIVAIRACNHNLQQVLPFVSDFETSKEPMLGIP
ncbi:hypothetical protein B0H14DRAFT_3855060 [Mycena olivaceomarginata]|nr:hypothetical protein B0H14DRAFT_3855060 [Mycena olivaceomarginata]